MAFAVKSAVKEYIAKKGKRTSSSALDALDIAIKEMLDKACKRATMEKVETVKDRHI